MSDDEPEIARGKPVGIGELVSVVLRRMPKPVENKKKSLMARVRAIVAGSTEKPRRY